jgi:hypothetical protein
MSSDSKSRHDRFEIPGYVTADLDDSMIGDFSGRSIGDEKSVEQHLARLFKAGVDTNDEQLTNALDMICRKLSVQRLVRTSYDTDWKMAVRKGRLDRRWWPLMLYLLLVVPGGAEVSTFERKGIELKRINAGLIGIDVSLEFGVNPVALSNLRLLAGQRLIELTAAKDLS